jgi:peptide/nickel transport system substrate-binding protein
MKISYRDRLRLLGGVGGYLGLRAAGIPIEEVFTTPARADDKLASTLRLVLTPEPPSLATAFNSAIMVQEISPKMLEGLVTYDKKFNMRPALATAWDVAGDGLAITFKLRQGVLWHDGKPFTSEDVKFTFESILKKFHPRGRTTFAHLETVETPDAHTAVFRLDTPSPYIMAALSASESPVLPKHLYESAPGPKNPQTSAPIGTGPFRFIEWQRGRYIMLERNPHYWAKNKPAIDKIIVRFIPDAGARAAAFETGEVDVGGPEPVPLSDISRLRKLPKLAVTTEGYALFGSMYYFEFNTRDPQFKDVRVRQAIAHAINRDFVAKDIWFGFGTPATGPISQKLTKFYSPDVPHYPFDKKKAETLLDAAGFPRKSDGIRFRITHDPSPYTEQYRRFGEYFKQAMRQIGIAVDLRASDAATWQRRIWTENSYQTSSYGIFNMPDPTIGVQRLFWSKNIRKGVPYSNGSGYTNPKMDQLLEAAQTEVDAKKRRALFAKMQALAMTDLPIIPIISVERLTVYSRRVQHLEDSIEGVFSTFADLTLKA